jgi:hypothetical protein
VEKTGEEGVGVQLDLMVCAKTGVCDELNVVVI